jgi:myo-inositol-1(or 4)-monophosphatase
VTTRSKAQDQDSAEALSALEQVRLVVQGLLPEVVRLRETVQYKYDGSPVTDADVLLEQQIASSLLASLGQLRVIGEEFGDSGVSGNGLVALIDPIDGTENFCSGLPEWGVSVGLWRDGDPLASLLMLPELGRYLMTGQEVPLVAHSRISGFSSSRAAGVLAELDEAVEYRISGCAVFNLYSVITGSFCRFSNPVGAYPWDILPGLCLALENNCEVQVDGKDFDGRLVTTSGKHRFDIRHRYGADPR